MTKEPDAIVTDDDRAVARSGIMLWLATADDWLGIPFGLVTIVELVRSGPARLKRRVQRDGILGTFWWVILAVALLYLLAPLREILWQIELFFAMISISIWLFFLPLVLLFLGYEVFTHGLTLVREWSHDHLIAFGKRSVRFTFLFLIWRLSVNYGDTARTFLDTHI